MKSYVVAISGASGCRIGIRLVKELLSKKSRVYLCISDQAIEIIRTETGIDWTSESASETEKKIRKHFSSRNIAFFSEGNLSAPISSGSFETDGMFVVPCSMKTLSAMANGYSSNLIVRAADVTLKEGRMLVVSPREMPFNAIHLENMLRLAHAGAIIAPPVPAFYNMPADIDDIIRFIVGKILDIAGIKNNLFKRWK